MPPCMKGRAASLEFLFLREKVPFACCVGEMGFALLYRGAGFCLRRAETGKAGMFRPFFVSCVESAKGGGWLYVEKVAFRTIRKWVCWEWWGEGGGLEGLQNHCRW